jgi:hypothetical protein
MKHMVPHYICAQDYLILLFFKYFFVFMNTKHNTR